MFPLHWGIAKGHGSAPSSEHTPRKESSQNLACQLLGLCQPPKACGDDHIPKIRGILAHIASSANREEFRFGKAVKRIKLGLDDLVFPAQKGNSRGRVLSDGQLNFQKRFHGWWHADFERGDSNKHLADAMELGWLMRKALNHLDKIHFDVQRDSLGTRARVWNLIDVNDRRPWSGEEVKVKRKDRRKGRATTWVEPTKTGFAVMMHWEDPYAAFAREEYSFVDEDTLLMAVYLKRKTGQTCNLRFYWDRRR